MSLDVGLLFHIEDYKLYFLYISLSREYQEYFIFNEYISASKNSHFQIADKYSLLHLKQASWNTAVLLQIYSAIQPC
jgi:hypothetical protein